MDVGTARQWAAAGISRGRLRTKIRRGELVQLRHGVYVTAEALAAADDQAKRHALQVRAVLASLPGAGTGAVASHESAAILHGLPLLEAVPEGAVWLTRPPGSIQGGAASGVRYHSGRLPAGHVTVAHEVPVTSAPRTVIDVARTRPFRDAVVVADAAIRMLKANKSELAGILQDSKRSPGVQNARRVMEFSSGKSGSPLESWARVLFHECGLPPPELQAEIHGGYQVADGKLLYLAEYHDYTVDFLWRDRMTIAETDGKLKYQSGWDAIKQNKRDMLLKDLGYQMVHITHEELSTFPALVVRRIQESFAATVRRKL